MILISEVVTLEIVLEEPRYELGRTMREDMVADPGYTDLVGEGCGA